MSLGRISKGFSMSILIALLAVLAIIVLIGVRLTVARSKYYQEHTKDLPPIPLGL